MAGFLNFAVVTTHHPLMLGDLQVLGNHTQMVWVHPHTKAAIGEASRQAVFITFERHQTCR